MSRADRSRNHLPPPPRDPRAPWHPGHRPDPDLGRSGRRLLRRGAAPSGAEAFALNLTNLGALRRAARAYRGRRGVARLGALLDGGGPRRTRSKPERLLLQAIKRAGLPAPETNARLGRWEIDFLWREDRLVVEVDAYSTHSSPRAFERDRLKDADLAARGLQVQRFSADRVRADVGSVVGWISNRVGAGP